MLNRRADKLELLRIAEAVALEKSIDKELIINSMETGIAKAARSKFGSENEIIVKINRDNGDIEIYRKLIIVENPENHPIHVHCFHGRERTGVMVAAYRITKHGYSFAEVIKEMKNYGFKPHLHFTLVLYLFLFSIL